MPLEPERERLVRLADRLHEIAPQTTARPFLMAFTDFMLDDPQAIIDVMVEFELLKAWTGPTSIRPEKLYRVVPKPHVHDYTVNRIRWEIATGGLVAMADLLCSCGERISKVPVDANKLLS